MKRIGIALAIALLGVGLAQGQYGYQYMSGGYWFGAQFIGQEGWMVGAKGAIMHTTDRGRNWVSQSNIERKLGYDPPNLSFNDVFFTNPQEGWACIDVWTQFIWHTTDGGRFWKAESLTLGTPYYYVPTTKVFFANPLTGWIVGGNPSYGDYGRILATTDGGRTWAYQDSSHGWYGVWATDANHCWAVGKNGWIARTTDGGANWTTQQVGPFITYYDVYFTDTLFGWACGYPGVVVHTTDGGQSWSQQPIGTTWELSALLFLNRRKGFVVGDSGVILKTTDGGTHWAQVPTGLTAYLSTISFGDSLHGWAIGEGGVTIETSDGGETWQVTRGGSTDRLQSLVFVDDSTGWAVSSEGKLFSTSNGGKNWSKRWFGPTYDAIEMVNPSTGWLVGENGRVIGTNDGWNTSYDPVDVTQENLKDIFAGDALHAWACGTHDVVIGTSNGGQTWQVQYTWPDTTLYDITFCDSLHGWALFQDGHHLRTKNKGQTWEFAGDVGNGNWYHLNFVDNTWGWAAGDSGISRSTDGGHNWTKQNAGITERLWDVTGVSRLKAWAVGESGRILATSDGGNTWNLQTSPVSTTWRGVDFADSLRGAACGEGYIIYTLNGGGTWTLANGGCNLYAIILIDTLEGWAAGESERIVHTTDGGMNWQWVYGGQYTLHAITFINRDEGWAGGSLGGWQEKILHTTDRGISWSPIRQSYGNPLYSLWFADNLRGWFGSGEFYTGRMIGTTDGGQTWRAVGYPRMFATTGNASTSQIGAICGSNGLLLRTSDGSTWERIMGPTTSNLWGIGFGDQQTGWSVGWKGLRMATTDQGMNWQIQRQDALPDSLLMSVQAFDGLTARATGYLGRSILTTDGGTTWQGEETGTKEWLLASSFLTPTLGWVVGENGMVLKYGRLPYGVEEGEKTAGVPRVTWLGPNHPNPFTGGTEIRYQLASRGKVKLGVYNVLGQTVRELASREQEAGIYSIRWDGKDGAGKATSSGVYFYRLEAFEQSQTRKMVKIR